MWVIAPFIFPCGSTHSKLKVTLVWTVVVRNERNLQPSFCRRFIHVMLSGFPTMVIPWVRWPDLSSVSSAYRQPIWPVPRHSSRIWVHPLRRSLSCSPTWLTLENMSAAQPIPTLAQDTNASAAPIVILLVILRAPQRNLCLSSFHLLRILSTSGSRYTPPPRATSIIYHTW